MMITRGLAQQRARLDVCEIHAARELLEEPDVIGCIDQRVAVPVEGRVGDRGSVCRRVAGVTRREVLQQIFHMREPEVRGVGEVIVRRNDHVVRIRARTVAYRESDGVGTRNRGKKGGDHRIGVGDRRGGLVGVRAAAARRDYGRPPQLLPYSPMSSCS